MAAYAEVGSIQQASAAADIDRTSHYVWLKRDDRYAELFEQARLMACDVWEDEARRRAFDGTDHPVVYQGEICDTYKEYSDTLAMFLMKANNPDKYKDRSAAEITGKDGGPIETRSVNDERDDLARNLDGIAAQVETGRDDKADDAGTT